MRIKATVKHLADGRFYARANATPVGVCEAYGADHDAVLERLRAEIRYQMEWCPCSGVADDYIELQVVP